MKQSPPISDASCVSRAFRSGVNIAYLVDDLAEEAKRLRALGFFPTGEPKPAIAFGENLIQFFTSRERLLFELIEAPDHKHVYFPTLNVGSCRERSPYLRGYHDHRS
jgi:methylmalonyl-CoA/ethylmalonyl-CoA epimerase